MVKNKKEKVENKSTLTKNFSYQKGETTLNFTLRTDIKTQLVDFLEVLKVAVKEVEEEIFK